MKKKALAKAKAMARAAKAQKKAAAKALNGHKKTANAYGKKLGAAGLKAIGGIKGVIKSLHKMKGLPKLPKSFLNKQKAADAAEKAAKAAANAAKLHAKKAKKKVFWLKNKRSDDLCPR